MRPHGASIVNLKGHGGGVFTTGLERMCAIFTTGIERMGEDREGLESGSRGLEGEYTITYIMGLL